MQPGPFHISMRPWACHEQHCGALLQRLREECQAASPCSSYPPASRSDPRHSTTDAAQQAVVSAAAVAYKQEGQAAVMNPYGCDQHGSLR